MLDETTREAFRLLYRLAEKYETPILTDDAKEAEAYFRGVLADVNSIYKRWPDNEFVKMLSVGMALAINDRFEKANPHKFAFREE